jgi:hypothetical protein
MSAGQYAEVWCSMCQEPADGPDALCTPHREGVPAGITNRWLALNYLRDVIRRPGKPKKEVRS